MAVVKYGSLVSEVRGSIGGVTFQRCGQSLSIRSNPSHVKAKSDMAMVCRARLQYLANKWSQLKKSSKDAWALAALDWPSFDRFGSPKILSGYQLFIYIQTYCVLCEESFSGVAPAYVPPPLWGATIADFSAADPALLINFASPGASNYKYLLFLSMPFSYRTSTSYIPLYFIDWVQSGALASWTIPAETMEALRVPLAEGLYFKAKFFCLYMSTNAVIPAEEIVFEILA